MQGCSSSNWRLDDSQRIVAVFFAQVFRVTQRLGPESKRTYREVDIRAQVFKERRARLGERWKTCFRNWFQSPEMKHLGRGRAVQRIVQARTAASATLRRRGCPRGCKRRERMNSSTRNPESVEKIITAVFTHVQELGRTPSSPIRSGRSFLWAPNRVSHESWCYRHAGWGHPPGVAILD